MQAVLQNKVPKIKFPSPPGSSWDGCSALQQTRPCRSVCKHHLTNLIPDPFLTETWPTWKSSPSAHLLDLGWVWQTRAPVLGQLPQMSLLIAGGNLTVLGLYQCCTLGVMCCSQDRLCFSQGRRRKAFGIGTDLLASTTAPPGRYGKHGKRKAASSSAKWGWCWAPPAEKGEASPGLFIWITRKLLTFNYDGPGLYKTSASPFGSWCQAPARCWHPHGKLGSSCPWCEAVQFLLRSVPPVGLVGPWLPAWTELQKAERWNFKAFIDFPVICSYFFSINTRFALSSALRIGMLPENDADNVIFIYRYGDIKWKIAWSARGGSNTSLL